jgi:hypothetical protein
MFFITREHIRHCTHDVVVALARRMDTAVGYLQTAGTCRTLLPLAGTKGILLPTTTVQ